MWDISRIALLIRRGRAQFCQRYYSLRYHVTIWKNRYRTTAVVAAILILVGCSAYLAPFLQALLAPSLADQDSIARVQSLFLNVGSALIGAAAIAFSLVLFAMQVNVERMPHGLFQRLSSDARILAAFVGSFLLAILLACTSLAAEKSWIAPLILANLWAVVLILLLFLYGYKRALLLINPIKQLSLLTETANREMYTWSRWAKRIAPLLDETEVHEGDDSQKLKSNHDVPRLTLFRINPNWTKGAMRSIRHAFSVARRYAESGDHEVSGAALTAIISINHAYIEAKGKTFFGTVSFFDNPLSTDAFINETLEQLRQNIRIGISRGDEQQIEQTLRALAALVQIYLQIDYSNAYASKTHAHLAGHYLSESVKAVARKDMADVVMEGVRLMGQSAHAILATDTGNDHGALVTEIMAVASMGAINDNYHGISLVGIEQLTSLTLMLIRSDTHEIRFMAAKLRENIALVAKTFLILPERPLSSPCSTCLAPYYSATTNQGFIAQFSQLVNAVTEAKPEDLAAQRVIRNIEHWADGTYQIQKELLLLAIEKRSQFAFDIVYWIALVTKSLLALSNAPACPEYLVDNLRKHASWLTHVLSWIPDDKDSTSFIEGYQLTETLFESAIDAYDRGCFELAVDIRKLLSQWAFKAGKHETGWHVLERALYGMATVAILRGGNSVCDALKRDITDQLSKPDAPGKEIRDRTARNIRSRAQTLYRNEHRYSVIDTTMSRTDHQQLRPLLEEIANILSPDTAGQCAGTHFD